MTSAVAIEKIDTTAGLRSLRPEWEALLASCPGHSLAVTPLWMISWWEVYGQDRELCVLAARDESGRLVGIAPLLLRSVRHRGMVPFRRLEFLGVGEPEADEVGSDYLDFIVHPDHQASINRQLCDFLFGELQDCWDEAVFSHLCDDSPRIAAIAAASANGRLTCEEADRRSGVYVTLPSTWEELLGRLDGDRRKSLLRRRRRLAEAGTVRFDWETTSENFERRWAILRDLHQRRWEAVGRKGCFASERFSRFHRQLADGLIPRGGLRIAVLSLDGRPIACDFYFVHGGRVHAYQAGLDPVDGQRLSAGTICISFGIEAAIQEGCREYDFLKGVHTYKSDWSPERREQVTLRVARPGAREQLRRTLETGITWARPLRRRVAAALRACWSSGAVPRPTSARRAP